MKVKYRGGYHNVLEIVDLDALYPSDERKGNAYILEGVDELVSPSDLSDASWDEESQEISSMANIRNKTIKLADKLQSTKLLKSASFKIKAKDFSQFSKNPIVSKQLFEAHIGLYEGYVKAYNNILSKLDSETGEGNYSYSLYSELKRRLSVPYNGAILHEMYFPHLKKNEKKKPKGKLKDLIEQKWGSVKEYTKDIENTALAAGNGWVVTFYSLEHGLENALITEHHIGHLVNQIPIMVFDMFEHAYVQDYSTKKKEYIKNFLDNLDFELIESRLPSDLQKETK